MASIKASIIGLGEKVGLIAEQSERIKSLEAEVATLKSISVADTATFKRAREEALTSLAAEQTAHAEVKKLLEEAANHNVRLLASNTEFEKALHDPKFAGNKLAAETLSKIGMKPVPESNEPAATAVAVKGREKTKAGFRAQIIAFQDSHK